MFETRDSDNLSITDIRYAGRFSPTCMHACIQADREKLTRSDRNLKLTKQAGPSYFLWYLHILNSFPHLSRARIYVRARVYKVAVLQKHCKFKSTMRNVCILYRLHNTPVSRNNHR